MAMETKALPVGLDLTGIEHPGLAARLTNIVSKPIELIGEVLSASASHVIATATSKGLEAALKVALRTMSKGLSHGIRCCRRLLRFGDTSH
jgi:hypothetical protein